MTYLLKEAWILCYYSRFQTAIAHNINCLQQTKFIQVFKHALVKYTTHHNRTPSSGEIIKITYPHFQYESLFRP